MCSFSEDGSSRRRSGGTAGHAVWWPLGVTHCDSALSRCTGHWARGSEQAALSPGGLSHA